jgi:hypothetical protein
MARGNSGRIIIEMEPEAKKRLYDALDLTGSTLKEWFLKHAADFCGETVQPSLFQLSETQSTKNGRRGKDFSMPNPKSKKPAL